MLVGLDSGKKDGDGCFVRLKRELGSNVAVLRPSSRAAWVLWSYSEEGGVTEVVDRKKLQGCLKDGWSERAGRKWREREIAEASSYFPLLLFTVFTFNSLLALPANSGTFCCQVLQYGC